MPAAADDDGGAVSVGIIPAAIGIAAIGIIIG
jgi:hypothetical protein